MKRIIFVIWLLGLQVFGQMAVNTTGSAPDASAMLDVSATDKGILIPRMTATERDNISSPATGLLVFVTDDNSFYYFDGTSWLQMTTSNKAWLLNGNAGTDSNTHFIGTTDAQDLVFKTNNNTHLIIDQNGLVGINITPGVASLSVAGSSSVYGVLGLVNGSNSFAGTFYNLDASGTAIVGAGNNLGITYLTSGSGMGGVGTQTGIYGYGYNTSDGTGIVGIGNGLTTYYVSGVGEGAAFTGNLYGISGYTVADNNNAVAIYGEYVNSNAYDGTGVLGYSMPAALYGYGVKGFGGWIGVYGETDSNGLYGVLSNGDLGASGTKSFAIDYPLDPANKILKHFSIESNEVLNMYRGNVVLDDQGEAVIQLPEYFLVINRNFSYNLTPVGESAQGLFIKQEIDHEGKFVISGGKPGQKISWYVFAERNDPYLQKYPEKRQVIVEKHPREKGKYIRPELYGQPKEKGMFYRKLDNKAVPQKVIRKDLKKK